MGLQQTSTNHRVLALRSLVVLVAVIFAQLGGAQPAYAAADVLLMGTTVSSPATSSLEYQKITSIIDSADNLPLTVEVATVGNWASRPYSAYKAIVIGDPPCGFGKPSTPGGALEQPELNATTWEAAVTGNVVIIGTDATFHKTGGGTGNGGGQLWESAIKFAVDGYNNSLGTGAVIVLACYYDYGTPAVGPTPVDLLKGFESSSTGIFTVQKAECANNVTIVAAHPALSGLGTPGLQSAALSNWGCSVHEGFVSWPSNFTPLAIATDTTVPHNFPAPPAKGEGFPYIVARGVTPVSLGGGILKVCKVAGEGVVVGTPFTFTVGSSSLTVPAGAGPGGTCVIGPSFPVGTTVKVTETIPTGYAVSSITVAPPARLVGTDIPGGAVKVTIGSGVTEVTYVDYKSSGYLEICKDKGVDGSFSFTVNPGGIGPIIVPAGACSPAFEVAAGTVVIKEAAVAGISMSGCGTLPADRQVSCDILARTSTVKVVPGDISTQTIAMIANRRGLVEAPVPTATSLACTAAPAGRWLNCGVRVIAMSRSPGVPMGVVTLRQGGVDLGTRQLDADGTASISVSPAGPLPIAATFSGAGFQSSVSQPVAARTGDQ